VIFDLSIVELLIISLFFITSINCAVTYFCCTKSLKILEEDRSINKAVNKLRVLDQYLLSKINMVVALFYFGLSYLFIESIVPQSNYIFLFSCLLSFPLTLITTFSSRVCYCYTCNVLLETKLNEFECLVVNFKRLIVIYLPFIIISFVVPTVYLLDFKEIILNIICIALLLGILFIWIIVTPKMMVLSYNARRIEKNTLLNYRLEKLMKIHDIKRYKLYWWDSSRSKESNAMVSGIGCYYLFVSSTLIEEITLPELETVVTHEIGHIKNKHLPKMIVAKLFVIISLVSLALVPQFMDFDGMDKIFFYFIVVVFVCLGMIVGVKIERKYEEQADVYASCYNDPSLFSSALRKISKYEMDKNNKIDDLFQSHPNVKDRINNVKSREK